ncbi:MAG: TspO/MBR family protein [Candidatus Promineifilaceae bacterium]
MRLRLRQIFVPASLALVIIVNTLAVTLPINNQSTEEISDSFPVFFVPAGYVFSIWGLIYLGLIAYVIYQLLPSQRQNRLHAQIAPWFILNCLCNSAWIFAWHYNQVALSVGIMLGILLTLCWIYWVIGIGRFPVSRGEAWLMRFPFSIYLAWITVATIANVTTFLYDIQWDGFGLAPDLWAVIMLIIAAIVTGMVTLRHHDPAFIGVVVWAFVGIAVKHSATQSVFGTALVMTVLVLLTFFIQTPRRRQIYDS